MARKIILLAVFLIAAIYAKAAVVYVNPNPDITYNTDGTQNPGIDLNSDGSFDLKFRLDASGAPFGNYVYHLGGLNTGSQGMMDATLGQNIYGCYYWKILSAGTLIGTASSNYQSTTTFPEPSLGDKTQAATNNNTINQGDCIIGIKFIAGGNVHYAWLRVNLTGPTTALIPNIVKDWAYESTPNTAIAAGDMGSGTTNIAVTGIAVNGQNGASVITTNGGSLQMMATITPSNATNQAVTWSVTNGTGSATINATGLLTAQSNGTVTVKATAQDGSNVNGTKTITITGQTASNVPVTGITVSGQGGASAITTNGGALQMTATIMPANATNQAVTWSVTPAGLATINAAGLLTAQANGIVTVKATAQDGSNVSGTKTITISGQTVGIKEINRIASSIYPNPVKNEVMLQFGKEEIIRNIRISNVAGQVVYKIDDAGKSKLISINTASLSEGLYILTFENVEGKQGLQKFVKNK